MLPSLTPSLGALAVTSLVILVSNSYKGTKKIAFQTFFFISGLAGGLTYLMMRKDEFKVSSFLRAFTGLPDDVKLALSIVVIAVSYFGGAMYIGGPSGADSTASIDMPASCDRAVDFTLPATMAEDDTVFFEQMFHKITAEIIADLPTVYEMNDEAVSWVERMIEYTVAGGKLNRGLAVVAVQQTFARSKGKTLTKRERCQAAALGWCVEFLQAFFLVADDAMDDSVTRRGQPCWFRLPEVKLIAINDSFILESCVYKILKRYFGAEPYYAQLVDLFIETTRQTELGQLLDLTSQPLNGKIDVNRFTLSRYEGIVKYKTAFYSFYLPVALGMIVSGIRDVSLYNKAREILMIMGEYFQIQDDYLDCYGSPEVIGKIGTDIEDNKCSWLVVQALARVTPKQRKVLEANYGKHDTEKVATIKTLYEDLKIEAVFKEYEESSYRDIQKLLATVQSMPKEVFEFLLKKIYKRAK